MSTKTDAILNEAKALNNPDLADAIEALEFLADEATENNQEYKDLVEMVKTGKPKPKPKTKAEQGDKGTVKPDSKENKGQANADESGKDKKPEKQRRKPKNYYKGIKMIGSLYYNREDKYRKGFSTADECAEHYNSK